MKVKFVISCKAKNLMQSLEEAFSKINEEGKYDREYFIEKITSKKL